MTSVPPTTTSYQTAWNVSAVLLVHSGRPATQKLASVTVRASLEAESVIAVNMVTLTSQPALSAIVTPKEQRRRYVTRTLGNACVRRDSVENVVTAMLQDSGVTHSSRAVAATRGGLPPQTVMPRVSVPVSLGSQGGVAVSAVRAISASLTVFHVIVTKLAVLESLATTRANASVRTTTVGRIVICAVKDFTTFLCVKSATVTLLVSWKLSEDVGMHQQENCASARSGSQEGYVTGASHCSGTCDRKTLKAVTHATATLQAHLGAWLCVTS